jgi:hypothetical protein
MLQDDARDDSGMAEDEMVTDADGAEKRRAYRRRLPFGRGAVLVVRKRSHIVGLADVSITGAYLTSRAPVRAGETHVLKLLLLPARMEIAFKVEIVRVSLADPESPDHPRGVAVRFLEVDDTSRDLLQAFVARGQRRPPA